MSDSLKEIKSQLTALHQSMAEVQEEFASLLKSIHPVNRESGSIS
ncbi:hypothetical protein [Algoriphagus boritolerans]